MRTYRHSVCPTIGTQIFAQLPLLQYVALLSLTSPPHRFCPMHSPGSQAKSTLSPAFLFDLTMIHDLMGRKYSWHFHVVLRFLGEDVDVKLIIF